MKKILKKYLIFSSLALFFIAAFASCASSPERSPGDNFTKIKAKTYQSVEDEPFYSQNKDLFVHKSLSNGISVTVKKSRYQKDCTVRLVLDSAPVMDSVKKAGLEQLTMDLMQAETKKYSSLYISSMVYANSTYLTASAHQDFLEYGVTFFKENLETVIDILSDTFTAPLLSAEKFFEYTKIEVPVSAYNDIQMHLAQKDPYFVPVYMMQESEISYTDVLNCFKGMQNASRIKIVASGNFSDEEIDGLVNLLNDKIGKIPVLKFTKKAAKSSFAIESSDILYNQKDNDKKCAAGIFKIPDMLTEDYLAYGIASLMMDDALYNQIKEKGTYAADAGCGVLISKIPFGVISVYDIKNNGPVIENVQSCIQQALTMEQITKKLEYYKRIYTSVIMTSEFYSSKTADQMATSSVYQNDAESYIKRPYEVNCITALNVHEIYEHYIKGNSIWFLDSTMTK